ncbi:hypothetical protein [Xenorhabdus taiwanensis]|uniref:Uncharacterized protein n=1 Tax=Xenorhabdus taiwanensis TaxID=3085177 RepID=A0ABM8JXR3_9GAMM|nr:hypothetical protein TCT1_17100 [Xenorhabdus sp. TCT-1]
MTDEELIEFIKWVIQFNMIKVGLPASNSCITQILDAGLSRRLKGGFLPYSDKGGVNFSKLWQVKSMSNTIETVIRVKDV